MISNNKYNIHNLESCNCRFTLIQLHKLHKAYNTFFWTAFTLNGEIMIDSSGQEIAFSKIPPNTALLPIVSLGIGQSGTLNLGKVFIFTYAVY